MKVSDYIVEFLIEKGITDVFGYPGGMVTHLMDSFSKYQDKINAHLSYHEQGAALEACGYAQVSGKMGVAYATSGPGATNMITGICNAYMDSIPVLFLTGQVNSFEQKKDLKVRQRGFQETDIVSMVKGVTKYAIQVNEASKIKYYLEKAFFIADEGRKGPVLLDIAMDVSRTEIDVNTLERFQIKEKEVYDYDISEVIRAIQKARRPVLLLGNGVERDTYKSKNWKCKLNQLQIPVVSSMIAIDIQSGLDYFYGFLGAYGDRVANFIIAKSDLVISIGSRLDVRQVGAKRENFAPDSKLIRVDIDSGELEYHIHEDEIDICTEANKFLESLVNVWPKKKYLDWIQVCETLKTNLVGIDEKKCNQYIYEISKEIPENSIITTDVGQNQVWVAQSFYVKSGQRVLFSGGHGAMGYSLPASIGAAIASKNNVYSFHGDGGIQMNLQELQMIAREKLPVKIILLNNHALGMIRHFQEMYFENRFFQTTQSGGFSSPDFQQIAQAYHLRYVAVTDVKEIKNLHTVLKDSEAVFIEIKLLEPTYVYPKLEYGKPNQDQEPLLERSLYEKLMNL